MQSMDHRIGRRVFPSFVIASLLFVTTQSFLGPSPRSIKDLQVNLSLGRLRSSPIDPEGAPTTEDSISPEPAELSPEEIKRQEKLKEIERLRSLEKFETKETGDYECRVCGWKYELKKGYQSYPAGTPFGSLPSTFKCPVCKAPKDAFTPIRETIAGFATNAAYGFGGNQMTSERKNLLIFGGLGFFFLLFLGGYLLE